MPPRIGLLPDVQLPEAPSIFKGVQNLLAAKGKIQSPHNNQLLTSLVQQMPSLSRGGSLQPFTTPKGMGAKSLINSGGTRSSNPLLTMGMRGGGYNPLTDPNTRSWSNYEAQQKAIEQAESIFSGDDSVAPGDASQASSGLQGVRQWESQMKKAAAETGVPWEVLAAIMGIESGGANINDPGGAMGLMQIMPEHWQATANKYGGNLNDPWTNIRTAADILRQNYDTYGSWEHAAAAYFGGGGAFSEGGYSGNQDSYGTTISAYVNAFRNNLTALGYGNPSFEESQNGGTPATGYASNAIERAKSALGTPYVWGGESYEEGGFDCSGLIQWAYGGNFGRTAQEQYDNTTRVLSSQIRPGDLIFFHTYDGGAQVTHVGMYLGNGQMIHAPKENDIVKVVSLDSDYWKNATVGYGRVG